MGRVYRARHRNLDKEVALKIIHPQLQADPHFAARFKRETRILGQLNSPHIVQPMDAGEWHETPFIVMELVDGDDLNALIRGKGTLSPTDSAEVIAQVAIGLKAIRDSGLVHRDLHPGNILLNRQGQIKIGDLGLVKTVDWPGEPVGLTDARDRVGAEAFMAPEQRARPDAVTAAADLFSLGCVWYYLLTARSLPRDPLTHHVTQLDQCLKSIPRSCRPLMLRLLNNEPDRRPGDAQDVVKTLKPLRRKARLAVLLDQQDRNPPQQSHYALAAGLAVLMVVFVTVAVLTLLTFTRPMSSPSVKRTRTDDPATSTTFTGLSNFDLNPEPDKYVENAFVATSPHELPALQTRLLPPRPVPTTASSGEFEETDQKLFGGYGTDVALADLDGDGDLDAFFANGTGWQVWLNDGRAFFTDTRQRLGMTHCETVALGDLDGDGDFDAVVTSMLASGSQCWMNDGTARFCRSNSIVLPVSDHVTLGDIDNDGDLDAVFSSKDGPMVALNDSNGQLVTNWRSIAVSTGTIPTISLRPTLGDLNCDSDLDIFLPYVTAIEGQSGASEVWLNNGDGFFLDSGDRYRNDDRKYNLQSLADIDLDRFESAGFGSHARFWVNNGVGKFIGKELGWGSTSPQAADFDGDHKIDALLAYSTLNGGLQLIRNVSQNSVAPNLEYSGIEHSCQQLAIGDLDGDGDIDGITVGKTSESGRVWLNRNHDDEPRFPERSVFDPEPAVLSGLPSSRLFAADFNGDDSPDLCFNAWKGSALLLLWLNDGSGNMARKQASLLHEYVTDGIATDIDGDGDNDLVIVTRDDKCFLLQNSGNGDFVSHEPVTGLNDIYCVGAGDFDADDDVDLILGSGYKGRTQLLRNDGYGRFAAETTSIVPSANNYVSRIGVEDLDGDSDLDLILVTGLISLWFNDGTGNFTNSEPIGKSKGNSAVFEDFDGDVICCWPSIFHHNEFFWETLTDRLQQKVLPIVA